MVKAATKTPVESKTQAPVKSGGKRPSTREQSLSPFDALRREVDRLFEDFHPMGWRHPFARPTAFELNWPRLEGLQVAPAMDVVERGDAYEITAELPGLDEKNVEIKLSSGTLMIKGEKEERKEESQKQ